MLFGIQHGYSGSGLFENSECRQWLWTVLAKPNFEHRDMLNCLHSG